jgi:multidrug efflux pump subunit AcrB
MDNVGDWVSCLHACDDGIYVALWDYCEQCLLIHFALEHMKAGMNKTEAMLESIKIRTRPVLMTAFAVSVGLLPVAQGSAIGLERLAPLGAVAIGGLIVGTFMMLVFIPLVFVWWVDEETVVGED